MTPLVDGRLLHLESRGLYEGVTLLWDRETGSLWHHITGTAMHGPLAGKRLAPVGNVFQTTVAAALETYPDAVIAISERPVERTSNSSPLLARIPILGGMIQRTMSREDTRRPSMEVGLGIWVDEGPARYYPLAVIQRAEGFVFDGFANRRVLIVHDPATGTPSALYTTATSGRWEGNDLHLSTGDVFRRGALYNQTGTLMKPARPLQVFTRWYGYALTFPATTIYEP